MTAHAPDQALTSHEGAGEIMGVEYDNHYCRLVACHRKLGLAR